MNHQSLTATEMPQILAPALMGHYNSGVGQGSMSLGEGARKHLKVSLQLADPDRYPAYETNN